MTHSLQRPPIATQDRDGREIYLVPLANTSLQARIFPVDYHRIIESGVSPLWQWNFGVVKVSGYRTNLQRISRLITSPAFNQNVRHIDRDPLNLRSDNLRLTTIRRQNLRQHNL